MLYFVLFFVFFLLFAFSFNKRRENIRAAAMMGTLLFLLVALRSTRVGPDTNGYVTLFLHNYKTGAFGRELEGFFLIWNSIWYSLHLGGQMYLIVCAIASVGLVLISIWKCSTQRVWSYALFLIVFSWYFYLSGIRQSLAMGCFTFGTYLLSRNIDSLSLKHWRHLFRRENVLALFFIFLAPLFHTSALFAVFILMIALFISRIKRNTFIWAIVISFVICLSALFRSAEELLQSMVFFLMDDIDIMSRYAGYAEAGYTYGTSMYLVLKEMLPLNFIALMCLILCKRDYDIHERLYFSLVIVANLFYYFSYMFRLQMYLYPAACIAIPNMLWPLFKGKKQTISGTILIIFMFLETYVNYVNLVKQTVFSYHFFFL